MTKIVSLIVTTNRRGSGDSESNPVREAVQLWLTDGTLLVESDPSIRPALSGSIINHAAMRGLLA